MTTIRVPCADCGPVVLPPDSVTVHRGHDARPVWTAVCPVCQRLIMRTIRGEGADLLVKAGAVECQVEPLTEADADEFAAMLDGPNWFEAVEDLVAGGGA